MGFDPLDWFCRPVADGVWAQETDSAFGAFTPCAVDSIVGNVSHLVLLGLCLYRVILTKINPKVQRYCLRSNFYNYVLAVLTSCCAAEPLYRLVMGISVFSFGEESGLAPFEMVDLGIEFISWCSMVLMLLVETKIYVKEFRWYIRFGFMYVLVGDAVIFNFIIQLKEFYAMPILYLFGSSILLQVFLGVLLFAYVPKLDSYPGYVPLADFVDDTKNEKPLGEQVCPERSASIFAGIYFNWMTPLMQQGYERPITEKDVWKLDSWDLTETLSRKFQKSWEGEIQRSKPWILRALNRSIGGRFWYAGIFKIGSDLSQLAGPVILNHLLQSLEQGDPAWVGYIYALSIFFSVSIGVLCEARYFQNVMRVGFRLRSTLVAAIFRKSLRLTHEARKNFPSGRITNMITTDANGLQDPRHRPGPAQRPAPDPRPKSKKKKVMHLAVHCDASLSALRCISQCTVMHLGIF